MAITVIGSVYDIPEVDLLALINANVGAGWDPNNAHLASVSANEVDGVIVSLRVAVETGN